VVRRLLAGEADVALGVDTCWQERYVHRTQHPPEDAEKVIIEEGRIARIHRDIDPAAAHGEYIGVAKFSTLGAHQLREHYHRCRVRSAGGPFREAAAFEKAYLIHLFQEMIEAGVPLTPVATPGGYMEIDTQQDYDLARRFWRD
jgi:choline kinase